MRTLRAIFVASMLLLANLQVCQGQINAFYTIKDGLSSSFIHDLIQDSEGYIWICTQEGLNRFDGKKFIQFNKIHGDTTSLPSSFVFTAMESSTAQLWVGTMNGLVRMDKAKNSFVRTEPSMRDYKIADIVEDKHGNIWAAAHGKGVLMFSPEGKLMKTLDEKDGIESIYISCIYYGDQGELWLGSRGRGIFVYNPATGGVKRYTKSQNGLSGDNILSISKDRMGRILVGAINENLCYFDKNNGMFLPLTTLGTELPARSAYAVASDKDNQLWIATDGFGLQKVDMATSRRMIYTGRADNCLTPSSKVHSILEDSQGNLWVGVFQKGLYKISENNSSFQYYCLNSFFFARGEVEHSSLCVTEDKQGCLWVGTDGDGLYRIDIATGKTQAMTEFANEAVTALFCDSKGDVWVGTYNSGARRYNAKMRRFDVSIVHSEELARSSKNYILAIDQDSSGNIWLATGGGGVIIYDSASGSTTIFSTREQLCKSYLSNDFANTILRDGDNMWIGTLSGLTVIDSHCKSAARYINTSNSRLSNDAVTSLLKDTEGNMWVGTNDGLNKIGLTGDIVSFANHNSFPSSVICGMQEDDYGVIWISTPGGLVKYDRQKQSFTNMAYYPEMLSGEFRAGCSYKSAKGRLYFGGTDGVVSFTPPLAQSNVDILNLKFTTLSYFEKSKEANSAEVNLPQQIEIGDMNQIVIGSKVSSFSVGFNAITYVAQSQVVYRTRMRGLNNYWEEVVDNVGYATFSKIPPGNYTLEVMAFVGEGQPIVRSIGIVVKPSFWMSWYAFVLYMLAIVAAIYATYQILQIRHGKYLDKIQSEQERELMSFKLDFFAEISHEIRSPLTLIRDPLSKLMKNTSDAKLHRSYSLMDRNVNRILSLINEMIDICKLDSNQYPISPEAIDLRSFSEWIMAHFMDVAEQNSISLSLEVQSDSSPIIFADKPSMEKIFFNILSNAIKYSPQGASIDLKIDCHGDSAIVEIRNTGLGIAPEIQDKIFNRFFQGRGDSKTSSGLGLYLTRKLVEMHKGTINVSVSEQYTQFTINMPKAEQADVVQITDGESQGEQVHIKEKLEPQRHRLKSTRKLLVIDDDADIRRYLSEELSPYYIVTEASNGQQGMMLANTDSPDLILCDIMMPDIDGVTLCRSLKNSEHTSHIPVILLTAKASVKEQIDGLRDSRAELYITKPFHIDYLLVCIKNLIGSSMHAIDKAQRAAHQQENNEQAEQMLSFEEKFLQRYNDLIDKNYSNPKLNVNYLSKELFVSRVHLHRRIKVAYNSTPSDMIMEHRLTIAEKIIIESNLSISEVAYRVGFNSAGCFTKAFKKRYGVTPTQYISMKASRQRDSKTLS